MTLTSVYEYLTLSKFRSHYFMHMLLSAICISVFVGQHLAVAVMAPWTPIKITYKFSLERMKVAKIIQSLNLFQIHKVTNYTVKTGHSTQG